MFNVRAQPFVTTPPPQSSHGHRRQRQNEPQRPTLTIARSAAPTTPADRAGAHADCFPASHGLPQMGRVGIRIVSFEASLRLHSHYGPPDRSAAHRRPLSRGSSPCGCPHEPLVSYRINRQLSGWILPPLMIRALRGALPPADLDTA
jgi:hypothetical protein